MKDYNVKIVLAIPSSTVDSSSFFKLADEPFAITSGSLETCKSVNDNFVKN